MKDINILLVGDYPPPYHGVSVQVSVLKQLLSSQPEIMCRILDIGLSRHQRRSQCLRVRNPLDFLLKLFFLAAQRNIIHVFTNGHNFKSWLLTLVGGIGGLLNGRKMVVSFGSGKLREYLSGAKGLTRMLVLTSLKLPRRVICMNDLTRDALLAAGLHGDKIVVLSPFYGIGSDEVGDVPEETDAFFRMHSPVIGVMAEPGPEYGVELLLDAATLLRSRYPHLGLILIGPGNQYAGRERAYVLQTGVIPERQTVLGIMQRLDLFVRPTLFDGDAVSVREALALGVPVVGSNVDFRPEGVILFRCGDVEDLTERIQIGLHMGRAERSRPQESKSESFKRLLAIYKQLG